jgi:hypothetical protein
MNKTAFNTSSKKEGFQDCLLLIIGLNKLKPTFGFVKYEPDTKTIANFQIHLDHLQYKPYLENQTFDGKKEKLLPSFQKTFDKIVKKKAFHSSNLGKPNFQK